jgi:hypothetical protein
MTDVLDTFFKAIGDTQTFLNQPHRLASLILPFSAFMWCYSEDKRSMVNKKKCIVDEGFAIRVESGRIVDCKEGLPPSHIIVSVWGAERHSFSLVLKNIQNKKEETLKL